MSGIKKSGFKILAKSIGIIAVFVFLIIASELIYTIKNRPDRIRFLKNQIVIFEKNYLETYDFEGTQKNILGSINNWFTLQVLYDYLSSREKNDYPDECKPLCIPYIESQKLLALFEKFDQTRAVSNLSPAKKSDLYFWMATIKVWHEDDKATLEYLVKSTSFSDKNERALLFKTEFQRLFDINNSDTQKFFSEKLESGQILKEYEKVYLAKSAYKLAGIKVGNGDIQSALYYFSKASDLNPYNITYHMALSGTYLYLKKPEDAEIVLTRCMDYLGEDAKDCKDRLAGIK